MRYEWHAHFTPKQWNRRLLQEVVNGSGDFKTIEDLYARLRLLAQSVEKSDWNTDAKALSNREKRPNVRGRVEIPKTYQRLTICYHDRPEDTCYTTEYITPRLRDYKDLGFDTPRLSETDMALLPAHSFFLYVPFTLAAPYMSKDDIAFYVHENPVRKDWVLKTPLVSATSWKGAFRSALRWHLKLDDKDQDPPRIIALLGNAKDEKENFRRGRLSFYSTFFDKLEVGVINPHSRETGAGRQPIYIEQVPREASGVFALLYVPIVPDERDGPLPDRARVLKDIDLIGKATYTLLVKLGFGAKTTSGMGRAKPEIKDGYLVSSQGCKPLGQMTELENLEQRAAKLTGGESA